MNTLNILLVEDNEIDVIITKEILDPSRVLETLDVVSTAEEAIAYLNNIAPFQKMQKPDLILLDINLPFSDGFGVLVEVKSTPQLSHIPVVILTSSTCEYDREFAMKNGTDCYIEKPLDIRMFKNFLNEFKETKKLEQAI